MAGRSIGRGAVASSGQVMTATKTAMATITVTTISTEQMMFNTLARVLCFLAPSTSPSILQSRACGNTWRLGGGRRKIWGPLPTWGSFQKGAGTSWMPSLGGQGVKLPMFPPHTQSWILGYGQQGGKVWG